MKPFEDFIIEEDDDSNSEDAKRNVINFIVSNFYRFINSGEGDDKSLLMLIAALSVLNTSEDQTAIQAARRLTQMALARRGKKDKK